MRRIDVFLSALLMLLAVSIRMSAQDAVPSMPRADVLAAAIDTASVRVRAHDTLPLIRVLIPSSFKETHDCMIADAAGSLNPFWDKLEDVLSGVSRDTLHILHVGDSHIHGHIYPLTVRDILMQYAGSMVQYTDMGINGATCATFSTPQHVHDIVSARPDLLILSFGTNESHSRAYDASTHYHQMEVLLSMVRDCLPDVPVLLTTPPGSYERTGRGRRAAYRVNPRTAGAASTILRFASDKHLAAWDLYNSCGGASRACLNWYGARLMQRDRIHYLAEGYTLQGQLLYLAIAKTFNHYVGSN